MKRLHTISQNFLRSPRLVKELVGHTDITKGDTVYDIGAGSGVITAVLASRAAQVVAIEYDKRTAAKLRENTAKYTNVTVIQGDFLRLPLPAEPYKVMANIPFHLSSRIVRRLTEASLPPSSISLIVQKQFAQKLLIDTDAFTGALGATIAPWFAVRIRKRLQRTDFWPHPAVDTVFVELKPRDVPLLPRNVQPDYGKFIEKCFHDQVYFAKLRKKHLWIGAETRPSQMTTGQWTRLFVEAT